MAKDTDIRLDPNYPNEKSPDRNRGHFYTYEDYPILIVCFCRFSFSPFFYQHICILYKASRVPCQTGSDAKTGNTIEQSPAIN